MIVFLKFNLILINYGEPLDLLIKVAASGDTTPDGD